TTTKGDGRDGQQQPPKGQTKGGGRDDTGSWKDRGGRGGHQEKDWNRRPKLTHRKPNGDEVIVLSVFDGVGAAPWLVWDLVGRPAAMFAWETDRAAMAVAKAQLPGLSCRGDLNDDDPAKVRDGEGRSLGTSFRVTDGPGHRGDRGGLFLQTVEFMSEVRRLVAPRRFGFIFENVEMATADAKQITEALGAAPLWVDAADFGWVGRPRLWWLSADWARMTLDPETG
ncbi:unnamed protein product, partial [Symbiodinium sp. KB8]